MTEPAKSENGNGNGLIVPSLIIAAALLGASLVLSSALDRTTGQLATVAETFSETMGGALAAGPPSGNRGAAPGAPRRPSPSKEHKVEVGKSPVRGAATAEITIIEWSDFQCPYCSRATPTLAKIQEAYGPKVRLAFKHLPLPMHSRAPAAHAASEAAHLQGKFWEMHDKIFASPRDLEASTFERYAAEMGLDVERFRRDVDSTEVKKRIDEDMRQAQELNVTGTPSFFINGRFLSGAQPFESFKRIIDAELEKGT